MTARVQMPAPDFRAQAMWNGEFKEVALSDFKGRFVVLFFYPLDFTFVCPTEILAFSDRLAEFEKLGASVVGASVDSQYTHLAWWKTPRKDGGIAGTGYPLLADLTKKIATEYGVLLDGGIALRGLFVIDPKGIVRQITINDLPIGRSVDEVLRVIQAIKFADEHGEVCPADWKPGARTIRPDPSESREVLLQGEQVRNSMLAKLAEEAEADLGVAEIEAEELAHRKMEMSLAYYEQHVEEIDVRLDELDREWDLNRLVQVCGAGLSVGGVGMGFLFGRKWFLLPGIAGWLLLQFGLRREVPPVPFLRRLGIRTSGEIDQERSALLGLRDGAGSEEEGEEGEEGGEQGGGGGAASSAKKKSRRKSEQQAEAQGG